MSSALFARRHVDCRSALHPHSRAEPGLAGDSLFEYTARPFPQIHRPFLSTTVHSSGIHTSVSTTRIIFFYFAAIIRVGDFTGCSSARNTDLSPTTPPPPTSSAPSNHQSMNTTRTEHGKTVRKAPWGGSMHRRSWLAAESDDAVVAWPPARLHGSIALLRGCCIRSSQYGK